ncbi:MAG: MscL family protein [Nanoarchaeota archaeon]|nr:MscL family protein [Nanoarchaeota archaeon]MBU1976788.1 MscL family protein [Nanoarchaeota archaeon]
MVFKNFIKFLKEYRIIAISVAFIVSLASLNFIQSIVNDIILPILRPLFFSNSTIWEEMVLQIGSANIRIGSFLSAFLSLSIILIFLYLFVGKILRWKPKK